MLQAKTNISPDPVNNPIWKETYELAHFMYGQIEEIAINFPNEKWNTESKLRNATNDSMFYVAQATGSSTNDATIYEWNNARKNIFTMRAMYTFAGKQKFVQIDPTIVVRIDKLMSEVDIKIEIAHKAVAAKTAEDLEPWLEKYRIWKKISE